MARAASRWASAAASAAPSEQGELDLVVVGPGLHVVVEDVVDGAAVVEVAVVTDGLEGVDEGETIELPGADPTGRAELSPTLPGAVAADRCADRATIQGLGGDQVHDPAHRRRAERSRRVAAVDLDPLEDLERELRQVHAVGAVGVERDAVQEDLDLAEGRAPDGHTGPVPEPTQATDAHTGRGVEQSRQVVAGSHRLVDDEHGHVGRSLARVGRLGPLLAHHDLGLAIASRIGRRISRVVGVGRDGQEEQ